SAFHIRGNRSLQRNLHQFERIKVADDGNRNMPRCAWMHHQRQLYFSLPRQRLVFVDLLEHLSRQIAPLEHREYKVFGEAAVGGYGDENFGVKMMDELFDRRVWK